MGYKILFLLGSSQDIIESSFSSVLRISESFGIDSLNILYSSFAKRHSARLAEMLAKIKCFRDIRIEQTLLEEKNYETQIKELLDSSTILCPTSGSRYYTIAATGLAREAGTTVVHVMFPYGPWKGMYYPFVPRFLQQLKIMNGNIVPNMEVNRILDDDSRSELERQWKKDMGQSKISIRVGNSSLDYNSSNYENFVTDSQLESLEIGIAKDGKVVSGKNIDGGIVSKIYNKTINGEPEFMVLDNGSMVKYEKPAKFVDFMDKFIRTSLGNVLDENSKYISKGDLVDLFGFCDITASYFDDKEQSLEEVSEISKGILVDTNMIYLGVGMYKGVKRLIPYCTYVEIANTRSELLKHKVGKLSNLYASLLWDSLIEIMETSPIVPTEAFFCDGVIPMIDPLLIKNCVIMTQDNGAYNHWTDIFSYSVKVMKAKVHKTANSYKAIFGLFLLSSVYKEI